MERKLTIEDLNNLKPGDEILANALHLDSVFAFTGKYRDGKYNIESDGKRCRSLGRQDDGSIKFVFAEEEGCRGDETEWRYGFIGLGSLEFDETDAQETIDGFNLRLIDESHPQFDLNLQKNGMMMGKMFSGFESILGNPFDENKPPNLEDSKIFNFFKDLGIPEEEIRETKKRIRKKKEK